jgi:hypothetical protein
LPSIEEAGLTARLIAGSFLSAPTRRDFFRNAVRRCTNGFGCRPFRR